MDDAKSLPTCAPLPLNNLNKTRANPDEEQGLHRKMAALTLTDLSAAQCHPVFIPLRIKKKAPSWTTWPVKYQPLSDPLSRVVCAFDAFVISTPNLNETAHQIKGALTGTEDITLLTKHFISPPVAAHPLTTLEDAQPEFVSRRILGPFPPCGFWIVPEGVGKKI